jgi:hypothetical protein
VETGADVKSCGINGYIRYDIASDNAESNESRASNTVFAATQPHGTDVQYWYVHTVMGSLAARITWA